MGLFSFVKNAGKKLWGSNEANAAEAIAKEVGDPDLKDKLKVEVVGDSVKIHGEVPTQEMNEKVIVAAGNVEGVAKVEEDLTTTRGGESDDGSYQGGLAHPVSTDDPNDTPLFNV